MVTAKSARKTTSPRKTVGAKASPGKAAVKAPAAPRKAAIVSAAPAAASTASAAVATPSAAPAKAPKAKHEAKKENKEPKAAKARKEKLVRDSFTMPEGEFKLIAAVKQRAMSFQREVKKSEVLRAGLMALQGLSEAQLRALLENLPVLKTGRPKKTG